MPTKNTKYWGGLFGVVVVVGLVAFFMNIDIGFKNKQNSSTEEKPAKLILGAEMSLLPATVWVAEDQNYFAEEGLDLQIIEFDSGRNALETLLKDHSFHIATVAQTPVVFNTRKGRKKNFKIIATMAYSFDEVKVLSHKKSKIVTGFDLVGKRVGATLRSTGHYFLEGFLAHYGHSVKDVKLIDGNAAKLNELLISGTVDAITTWEPHIHSTQQKIGKDNIALLVSPTPFRKDFYFTVEPEVYRDNLEGIDKFLRAVIRAEAFILEKPAKSQSIVANRLGIDLGLVKRIWDKFSFKINLDQSSLVALEDEARWAIANEYIEGPVSNFLNYMETRPLTKIKPESVTIIN